MALKTWLGGDASGTTNWGVHANWTPSGVPVANDVVVVPAAAGYAISVGLDQSAVAIDSFEVEEGYSYDIGTTTEFLQISVTGSGTKYMKYAGVGSLARVGLGASAITPIVRNTGVASAGQHALEIKGTAMTGVDIFKGNVGIGVEPTDTTTDCDTINVMYATESGRSSDVNVEIGAGVSGNSGPVNINQTGGVVYNWTDASSVKCKDGEYHQLDCNYSDGKFSGGSSVYLENGSTYALTELWDSSAAVVQDLQSFTFTNITMYSGTSWSDELLKGTYSNAIKCPNGLHNVSVNFGPYVDFLPTAI